MSSSQSGGVHWHENSREDSGRKSRCRDLLRNSSHNQLQPPWVLGDVISVMRLCCHTWHFRFVMEAKRSSSYTSTHGEHSWSK